MIEFLKDLFFPITGSSSKSFVYRKDGRIAPTIFKFPTFTNMAAELTADAFYMVATHK